MVTNPKDRFYRVETNNSDVFMYAQTNEQIKAVSMMAMKEITLNSMTSTSVN